VKSERKTKKTKENQEKTKKTEKSPLKNSFESGKIKCSKSGQSSCALTLSLDIELYQESTDDLTNALNTLETSLTKIMKSLQ